MFGSRLLSTNVLDVNKAQFWHDSDACELYCLHLTQIWQNRNRRTIKYRKCPVLPSRRWQEICENVTIWQPDMKTRHGEMFSLKYGKIFGHQEFPGVKETKVKCKVRGRKWWLTEQRSKVIPPCCHFWNTNSFQHESKQELSSKSPSPNPKVLPLKV